MRRCIICQKKPFKGNSLARRGSPKRKGGTGLKTTRVSRRTFLPNLQKIRILHNKRVMRAYVCAECIKSGRVQKA
ncbi:MAG: 50S ribosomal protein L28 [Candidatus Omnitrophica bacterium]|nr:50S ribosomal protein L28 [Candidatus Omnitrophota bacterium]